MLGSRAKNLIFSASAMATAVASNELLRRNRDRFVLQEQKPNAFESKEATVTLRYIVRGGAR